MKITSPITGSLNVEVVDIIAKEEIISRYKNDLDIDVSKYFTQIDAVKICKCLDTQYVFYFPLDVFGDEDFYDQLKVQLPAKYNTPYYTSWKWEYDICREFIKQTDKLYEIGCGHGDFLSSLKKSGVADVYGSELNANSVERCLQKDLNVEYKTVEEKAKVVKDEFDVVCAFQVLEHVPSVKSFLDASLEILKPGGLLIIAVPFNAPYLFKHDKYNTLNMPPHHMALWSKEAFSSLPKFLPMRIEKIIIETLPNSGYDFNQYFLINKDLIFSPALPFKKILDALYYKWLKRNHYKKKGKNIVAIFRKIES